MLELLEGSAANQVPDLLSWYVESEFSSPFLFSDVSLKQLKHDDHSSQVFCAVCSVCFRSMFMRRRPHCPTTDVQHRCSNAAAISGYVLLPLQSGGSRILSGLCFKHKGFWRTAAPSHALELAPGFSCHLLENTGC